MKKGMKEEQTLITVIVHVRMVYGFRKALFPVFDHFFVIVIHSRVSTLFCLLIFYYS